jgi:hypothetical protein
MISEIAGFHCDAEIVYKTKKYRIYPVNPSAEHLQDDTLQAIVLAGLKATFYSAVNSCHFNLNACNYLKGSDLSAILLTSPDIFRKNK